MSGMPEIIGESQLGTLDPIGESPRNRSGDRPHETVLHLRATVDHSGTNMSPSRLRLHDFSGEGERAPPEPCRLGQ